MAAIDRTTAMFVRHGSDPADLQRGDRRSPR
jgi:hypothetical protein